MARALSSPIDAAPAGGGRQASVLVAIRGRGRLVVMARKSASLREHAGEMAFPGGAWQRGDADLLDTALREAREEVGLDVGRGAVVGQLARVRTSGTGFTVTPFVHVSLDEPPALSASAEVDRVYAAPLGPLLGTEGVSRGGPSYELGGDTVWGASARILADLAGRLGAARSLV